MHDPHGLQDPIFKGCTRPAMFLGVPLPWLLISAGALILASPYLLYFVHPVSVAVAAALYVPFYLWMRAVTTADDQRLRQLTMRTWVRAPQLRSRAYWQAVSYGPIRYRRRRP